MRVAESITLRCRPSAVWEVVGDPRRYEELMSGVTRWRRVGADGPIGVGAHYSIRMLVGAAEVGGVVEIVECEPCCDLAWNAVTGIAQRGRWRLREVDPGVTEVTLRLSYQAPGGVWGLVADRLAAPQVRAAMRRTLARLRRDIEGEAESRRGERGLAQTTDFARHQLRAVRVLARAGIIRAERPDRLVGAVLALHRWGFGLAGGYAAAAARDPRRPAVVDDAGEVTAAEVDRRTDALATGLSGLGVREGDRVGLLCRNHRGFIEASVALAKLGADVLYLNTGFAAPQLAEVVRREEAVALIHDAEFAGLLGSVDRRVRRIVARPEEPRSNAENGSRRNGRARPAPSRRRRGAAAPTLESLIAQAPRGGLDPPERASRITILTSGTTGAPKGASRGQPRTADPLVAILSRIPLRAREPTLIAAPLFHAWGAAHLGLGVLLDSTLVLQRRFDPEATLAAIEEHRVTTLAAVPVMLQRILDLPASKRRRHDTSSLRVVAVSGSALSADLARRFMDEFGDVVYNLYGSTEVAWVTIATPEELRDAPGTVGRPPAGTVVRLLDEHGRDVAAGEVGRIFVGNDMLFEGYTGGGGKDVVDGLMATGDMGRFDDEGRLFVEGRDDEMIVSGGENVFPAEVEELLSAHRDITEVAVVGVEDKEWGQRLAAYVVRRRGARLSADAVKGHVRSHLARYKVPRDVEFVASLPRTSTGKVVKRELVERR